MKYIPFDFAIAHTFDADMLVIVIIQQIQSIGIIGDDVQQGLGLIGIYVIPIQYLPDHS